MLEKWSQWTVLWDEPLEVTSILAQIEIVVSI